MMRYNLNSTYRSQDSSPMNREITDFDECFIPVVIVNLFNLPVHKLICGLKEYTTINTVSCLQNFYDTTIFANIIFLFLFVYKLSNAFLMIN